MDRQNTILSTSSLSVGYRQQQGQRLLAEHLDLSLHAGELTCLLGANGIGKSTLMRTLAGMHAPLSGLVLLEQTDVRHLKTNDLAQKVSVVLTDRVATGNLSVYSVVAMGRYPYTGWLGRMHEKDHQVVKWAIQTTAIGHLANRHLYHLSDGERQKVMIARALAQDTPLILLDEPTVHLDLPNRMGIVSLLRKLVKETGKTVLMSTHDLDIALQCADKLWLMHDQTVEAGVPEDLLLSGAIRQVFQKEGIQFDLSSGTFRLQPVFTRGLNLSGKGDTFVWTRRAMEREGYAVNKAASASIRIEIGDKHHKTGWLLISDEQAKVCYSIEELIHQLRNINTGKLK